MTKYDEVGKFVDNGMLVHFDLFNERANLMIAKSEAKPVRSCLLHEQYPQLVEAPSGLIRLRPLAVDKGVPFIEQVLRVVQEAKLETPAVHNIIRAGEHWVVDRILDQLLMRHATEQTDAQFVVVCPIPIKASDGTMVWLMWEKRTSFPNPFLHHLSPTESPPFDHCYVAGLSSSTT